MSKKETVITLDEWLQNAFPQEQPKPENSFTVLELANKMNVNIRTMRGRLEQMISKGELVKGKFMDGGKLTNWYMPKQFYKK